MLLKIDIQGFEQEVLKGTTDLPPKINAVEVEASDLDFYEGLVLHEEIAHFLIEAGVRLDARFNTHVHQGEPVQAWLGCFGAEFRVYANQHREPK
ncbi:FkbM family methyltransferase [Thiocapsa bogorovii]|uniref:FkbM family methyltransferase n=1 Tax=Thiocapsa bogorovii TaxID=521689 RepID=UPI001E558BD6|nr:FkbM family methyltransferase [Thiocapsa bogorovii]UHD15494.1 FkbM family methyltransferase [Thiocapsa bogorovii]